MRATEFLADLVQRLDGAELEYALVGSIAAMSFGEPRATLDIDVVVALETSDLTTFQRLFPVPDFYLSADAAREAVASRQQFNVIHPTSGMKVDFFVAGDDIERAQLERRVRRLILPGVEAWCSPPEEFQSVGLRSGGFRSLEDDPPSTQPNHVSGTSAELPGGVSTVAVHRVRVLDWPRPCTPTPCPGPPR